MIALLFAWGFSGVLIGATGSQDVLVLGLILLGMACVAWLVNSLYTGWLTQRNASYVLEESERRRIGGR